MLWIECTIFAVFACPMIALLFASMFKLDELAARPPVPVLQRRLMPCVDRNGYPACVDPDGRFFLPARKGQRG